MRTGYTKMNADVAAAAKAATAKDVTAAPDDLRVCSLGGEYLVLRGGDVVGSSRRTFFVPSSCWYRLLVV